MLEHAVVEQGGEPGAEARLLAAAAADVMMQPGI